MIPEMDNNVKLVWNFEELTDFGASGALGKSHGRKKARKMKSVLVDYLVDFVQRMDQSETGAMAQSTVNKVPGGPIFHRWDHLA